MTEINPDSIPSRHQADVEHQRFRDEGGAKRMLLHLLRQSTSDLFSVVDISFIAKTGDFPVASKLRNHWR